MIAENKNEGASIEEHNSTICRKTH